MRPGTEDDALRARYARHMQVQRDRLERWLPLLSPAFHGSTESGYVTADDAGFRLGVSGAGDSGTVHLRVGQAADQVVRDLLDDVLHKQSSRSDHDDTDTSPIEEEMTFVVAGTPVTTVATRRGAVWTAVLPLPPSATGMPVDLGQLDAVRTGWNVEPAAVTPGTDHRPHPVVPAFGRADDWRRSRASRAAETCGQSARARGGVGTYRPDRRAATFRP